MHGIVHKTLKEYVVEKTDEETWETVVDRAGLEPKLYLPVSRYEDDEIDAILETLAAMTTADRRTIERDFGRALAPELLSTFKAHVRAEWGPEDVLASIGTIADSVEGTTGDGTLPDVSSSVDPDGDAVAIAYRTHREHVYCGLAHGILEGLVAEFGADATVAKQACLEDPDGDRCRFRVEFG
ncbi:heme NO-binding domain-containing protein [Halosolutus gelatinilyticus]|uniref:heme NO-binding domain-containing protein n=1 Tax=Halosolutus gelatinilyticus TaxID=2931975 RepID=UPI001FF2EE0B|nr:heme NO-binding domain-containing protein [Halosolutus gelatinilyticus]